MADAKPPAPPAPAKKRSLGGVKNWATLGVVGLVGFYAYKKWVVPELAEAKSDAGRKPGVAGPDLNGPMVNKFTIASTKTKTCIDKPVKGFSYSPITSTNFMTGYQTFSASATGHFTRRLLCMGSKKWAEIAPLRTAV